jgi:hypothetical protein
LRAVEEVRHAQALGDPAAQVGDDLREIGGVVREERGQLLDRGGDPADDRLGLGGVLDRAVLGLERAELLDGVLERLPGG